jgi:hypothetical protein
MSTKVKKSLRPLSSWKKAWIAAVKAQILEDKTKFYR